MKRRLKEEKEEEEKHQHLPVDSINLFNIIMVSSRECSNFVDFPKVINVWFWMEVGDDGDLDERRVGSSIF